MPIGGRAISFTVSQNIEIDVIDFDRGRVAPRILLHNPTTGTLTVNQLDSTGPGVGTELINYTATGAKVLTADLNEDGFDDLVIRQADGTVRVVYLTDGIPSVVTSVHATAVGAPWEMLVADINEDRLYDFVWRNPNTGVIWWQEFTTSSTPTGGLINTTIGRPWVLTNAR